MDHENLKNMLASLDNMPEPNKLVFFRGVNLSLMRDHLTATHWLKLVDWLYDRWKRAESAKRGRESLDDLFDVFRGR